jgi:hypothetical protein
MDPHQMQAAADRLAARLDALDLDAEEREVLTAMLGSGAASVETAGDEVEGFALNAYLSLKGQKQGKSPSALDDTPHESISFNFGSIQFQYLVQD